MDIVQEVSQVVLPKVLSDPKSQINESGLISEFITVFLTKLVNDDDSSVMNPDLSGIAILQAVFKSEQRNTLISNLSETYEMNNNTAQGLLEKSAPIIINELNEKRGLESVKSFLDDDLGSLGTRLPIWSAGFFSSAILGKLGTLATNTAAAPLKQDSFVKKSQLSKSVEPTVVHNSSDGNMKRLIVILSAILIGIILVLLLKYCSMNSQDINSDSNELEGVNIQENINNENNLTIQNPVVVDLKDIELSLTTDEKNSVINCSGIVGNLEQQTQILNAVEEVFQAKKKCFDIKINAIYKKELIGQDQLIKSFEAVKSFENVHLDLEGHRVDIHAKNLDEQRKLANQLKQTLLGYNIKEVAHVKRAEKFNPESVVDHKIKESLYELNKLDNKATGEQIAEALNIQVINFETGKYDIPTKNRVVLEKAANLLKTHDDIKMIIIGHTDSIGNEKTNIELSANRAKTVLDYLVKHGVNKDQLSSSGVGSSDPIVSDDTEEGRFKNRRISFDIE